MKTRRLFLLQTAKAAAVAAAFPHIVTTKTWGAPGTPPSGLIRLGYIGVGNQGSGNLSATIKHAVAVCDVDSKRVAAARARVEKAASKTCATYSDYRKLLEDKNVDAVVVTTPDHWHALVTVDACAAGKDVYCEKPLSLTVADGRAMVKAARRHQRIVQTGSQQRSAANFRKACELVRSGYLGKIHTVRAGIASVNFKGPAVPNSEPPAELDYDFWLGPAPQRPYNVNRVHYNFRFFWDYSGGQMTNWGAHHLDIAQWGLGMDESGPTSAQGSARYHKDGWYEVPEWSEVTYRYPNGIKLICGQGEKMGTTFEGDKGTLFVNRGVLKAEPATILETELTDRDVRLESSTNHFANWFDCIKSRKLPICDVEVGHRSATVCHLGNIALRLGRKISWDPKTETIESDPAATAMLARPYRAPWKLPNS